MDYGKEAYCKVSELEALINSDRQTASSATGVYDPAKGGRQTVAAYEGGNALVSVTVNSEGAGKVRVYFGGAKASDIAAGGTSCVTFAVSGSGDVEVDADESVTVTDVSVAVIGNGALSFSDNGKLTADSCAEKTYAAALKDGSLKLYLLTDGVFCEVFDVGRADDFDICAEENALTLVTARGGKSTITRITDERLFCAAMDGGSAVAIDRDDQGLVAARYDGKRVTVTRLSDELGVLGSTSCHGSPSADALTFVKHSPRARLIVSDGGKNLLRTSDDSGGAYVKIKCAVTAGETV